AFLPLFRKQFSFLGFRFSFPSLMITAFAACLSFFVSLNYVTFLALPSFDHQYFHPSLLHVFSVRIFFSSFLLFSPSPPFSSLFPFFSFFFFSSLFSSFFFLFFFSPFFPSPFFLSSPSLPFSPP
ncbi:hypothetical protein CFK62_09530, partial [Streptococcus agalactiae]